MSSQILLIDDSAMLRRIAANVLRAQPARYEVIATTRASEGFARACGGVALILVDERIAAGADADLCQRLLDEPRTRGIPVVLLLGRHADASNLGALPGNVVSTLRKPFAPEQLASLVNAVVARVKTGACLDDIRQAWHQETALPTVLLHTDQPLPAETATDTSAVISIRAEMQAVASRAETGVLKINPAGGAATEVYFDGGRIMLVSTRDGTAYGTGAAEVLPTKVSPATLQGAAAEQAATGIPFLLTLGTRGLVSKAAAVELLRRFGQKYFARLWTVPGRSLRAGFEPSEALPGFALRLEPACETVDDWLLGTLRLLTVKDIAHESRHQGLVGTPALTRRGETMSKALKLDDAEREFLRRVNGRHDLPTIARGLNITSDDAFLLMHRFRCLELIEYHPAPLPFVLTPRTTMRRVLPLQR